MKFSTSELVLTFLGVVILSAGVYFVSNYDVVGFFREYNVSQIPKY